MTLNREHKKRIAFLFDYDIALKMKLEELAEADGLSKADVLRMLINREYNARYGGNGKNPPAYYPQPNQEDKKNA
jgi:hypothetical protein